jgi:hypothetical protein
VTRGEVAFGVGDRTAVARVGTFVHVPAGTTHWFRYGAGGGEMVSLTSREGTASMFSDFHREIAPDAPNRARLMQIAESHGAHIVAPPA